MCNWYAYIKKCNLIKYLIIFFRYFYHGLAYLNDFDQQEIFKSLLKGKKNRKQEQYFTNSHKN